MSIEAQRLSCQKAKELRTTCTSSDSIVLHHAGRSHGNLLFPKTAYKIHGNQTRLDANLRILALMYSTCKATLPQDKPHSFRLRLALLHTEFIFRLPQRQKRSKVGVHLSYVCIVRATPTNSFTDIWQDVLEEGSTRHRGNPQQAAVA